LELPGVGWRVGSGWHVGGGRICWTEAFTRREPDFILNAARGSLFDRPEKSGVNLAHGIFSIREKRAEEVQISLDSEYCFRVLYAMF
jgi:hypothetical protein